MTFGCSKPEVRTRDGCMAGLIVRFHMNMAPHAAIHTMQKMPNLSGLGSRLASQMGESVHDPWEGSMCFQNLTACRCKVMPRSGATLTVIQGKIYLYGGQVCSLQHCQWHCQEFRS